MKRSVAVLVLVLMAVVPAMAADVFSTGFDAGYAVAPLWGQSTGTGGQWASSVYSSNPAGTPDTWLSNPNVAVDPTNAANQALQFYGDCSGGTVHGAAASAVFSANATQDITFTQSAYFGSDHTGRQSLAMSLFDFGTGSRTPNVTFGNYDYWFTDSSTATYNSLNAGNVCWSLWNPNKSNHHTGGMGDFESLLFPKNTWATATVTFHMATLTADLVVVANGATQQVLGVAAPYISHGTANGLTRYDMYVDGAKNVQGTLLLDNVQITQAGVTPLYIHAQPGDVNNDGACNVVDLGVLAKYYDSTGLATSATDPFGAGSWTKADFNNDGTVNVVDLGVLAKNYDWVGTPAVPTPEPMTLSLLGAGALALIRRNKK